MKKKSFVIKESHTKILQSVYFAYEVASSALIPIESIYRMDPLVI